MLRRLTACRDTSMSYQSLSHQNTAKHTATKWHIAAIAVHAWNSS